jgi:hypothetical protein
MKFLSIGMVFLMGCSSEGNKTINEQYPFKWEVPDSEEMITISRIIVKNHLTGCGEYYEKNSANDDQKVLIGCTGNGRDWKYYKINKSSQELEEVYDTAIKAPIHADN